MGRPLGERAKRFVHMSGLHGEFIYVAAFSTGVVKIGYSANPAKRLRQIDEQLARRNAGTIAEFSVCDTFGNHRHARRVEADVIVRLGCIATPVAGTREYFTGITFDAALAVVRAAIPA